MRLLNKIKKKIKGMFFKETPIKVAGIPLPFVPLNFNPAKTVPAPVILENDPWFGEPVLTQKALDKKREIDHNKKVEAENQVESPNIHQEMYELATKNWTTVKETEGWQSGTGYNQFRP